MSMTNIFAIINQNDDIKSVFGSFAILDEIDIIDHPQLYQFAKIVNNYLHMKKILDETD